MKKKMLKMISIVIILLTISFSLIIKKEKLTSSAIKQQRASDATIEAVQSASQGLIVYADKLKKDTIVEEDLKHNTEYLQKSIDNVSSAGGGTVHIPAGTYYFTTGEYKRENLSECVIKCRDNVLIEGEGTNESTGTVLKPYAPDNNLPVDMFYFNDYAESGGENNKFLKNADFKNFVIDGEDAYATRYTTAGKGFMINLFENCDFENVVVKNTDGTGFGIDCPINSTIKNCVVINCGKRGYLYEEVYGSEAPGASGFGIGTGYSNDESIIISNCASTGNFKYGFFFEHQSRFGGSDYKAENSKGFVVSNCTAKGNRYDFGGARGNDVTYENCVSYSKENDENTEAAIHFEEYSIRTHMVNCKTSMQFLDVSDSSKYYYEPVYWVVNNAITTGLTKESFQPESICTRAQAVTFLWRMAERPGQVLIGNSSEISKYFETGYEDVSNTDSYVDAVKWAKEEGIIEAGTNFYPNNECTRAEFVTMLWKYAGKTIVETESNFVDIADGASYIDAVNWAFEKGIISGELNSEFFPDDGIRRGDLVTLLYRFSNSNSSFSITYNLNGGKLDKPNPNIYESGKDEFTLINPTKTGYTFYGWTGSNYSEYVSSNYIPQTTAEITTNDVGNKTYTANWTGNNYTVVFDANGGNGSMEEELFTYDMPQVLLTNKFTKNGYSFLEWNTQKDGTGVSYNDEEVVTNLSSVADKQVTLYAQWEPLLVEYQVEHYKQNIDGTYPTTAEIEVLEAYVGTSVTPETKTYEGFTAPSNQTVEVAGDGSTVIKYYYTRNTYTVIVTEGTGIEEIAGAGTYKYGQEVELEATLKNGYENATWTGDYTTNTFNMPAENVEVSVNAEIKKYTITYNLDGGTVEGNPIEYTVETEGIKLKEPTKENYEFIGWTGSNGEDAQKEVTISKGTTGNLTYTANWKVTRPEEPEKLEIQITYTTKKLTNQNVTVTITANKTVQEVKGWILSSNGKELTREYTSNTVVEGENITVKDLAGNESKVNVKVLNIDKELPTLEINTEITSTTIKVEVTASDTGSGINEESYKYYIKDENETYGDGIADGNTHIFTNLKTGQKYDIKVEVTDNAGNKTSKEVQVTTKNSNKITSTEYKIYEEKLMIKEIQPKITVGEIKNKIQGEMEFKIINAKGEKVSNTDKVATGYKIKLEDDKEYTLVVIGDTNGDGETDIKDILAINKHRLNKANLVGGYLEAGDVNGDGKADIKDIFQINKFRLGKISAL